jgi:hypothetical protein
MFNINDVNKYVAKRLNIDVSTVKRINDVYYNEFIKALNSLEDREVKLIYLGTWKARYAVLKKRIRDVIKELRTLNKPETVRINKEEQKEFFKRELRKLWKIKQEFDAENWNKMIKKKNKHES